jgi:hypothetical protein
MNKALLSLIVCMLLGFGGVLSGCGEQGGEPQTTQRQPEQAPPVTDPSPPQPEHPAQQEQSNQEGGGS